MQTDLNSDSQSLSKSRIENRFNKLLFTYPAFLFFLNQQVNAQENLKPAEYLFDLLPGTEMTIKLDQPQLYSENEIEWTSIEPNTKMRCSLVVTTHFDEDLVRTLKTATYFIDKASFSDSTGKYFKPYSSQWNVVLDHENKLLPGLVLTCLFEGDGLASKPLPTLANVEAITNSELKFEDKNYKKDLLVPLQIMMPNYPNRFKVFAPLNFSFKSTSQNSGTPSVLFAQNGELLSSLANAIEISHCEMSYSWSSVSRDAEITLLPGALLDQNYISQSFTPLSNGTNYYSFTIQSTMQEGLTIRCFHPSHFKDISEIRSHLRGIIEF